MGWFNNWVTWRFRILGINATVFSPNKGGANSNTSVQLGIDYSCLQMSISTLGGKRLNIGGHASGGRICLFCFLFGSNSFPHMVILGPICVAKLKSVE